MDETQKDSCDEDEIQYSFDTKIDLDDLISSTLNDIDGEDEAIDEELEQEYNKMQTHLKAAESRTLEHCTI